MQPTPRLIVGLGNPGTEYEGTRHNIGFAVIDEIRNRLPGGSEQEHIADSFVWSARFAGSMLRMQKPQTYMNLSGHAVAKLARLHQLAPEEILVVYDDLDLPIGRLRLRTKGSSGGHRGVESIINSLESNVFSRLRLGIGRATAGETVADYVLDPFDDDERPLATAVVEAAADAILLAAKRGVTAAMNQFNCVDLARQDEEEGDETEKNEQPEQ